MKRVDLSVGQRLAAGTAVTALLVAILGALLVASVMRVSTLRREKLEVVAPRLEAANDLERAVFRQAVQFRNYVLTRSPDDFDSFRTAAETVRLQAAKAAELSRGSRAAGLLDQMIADIDQHQRSFEDLVALMHGNADARAIDEAEAHVSSHREELLRKVRTFASLQAQQAEELDLAINRAVDDLRLAVIVVTLLILAASGVTTWIVSRRVREPAAQLIGAAAAMGAGDFGPALALEDHTGDRQNGPLRDELREASHAFGGMARALQMREERLAAHARLSAALSSSLDPREVAEQALREITAHTRAAVGAVYLADAERPLLRGIATVALGADLEPVAFGAGVPGEAASEQRTIVARDMAEEGAPFRLQFGFGSAAMRCVAAIPMLVRQRVLGVLLAGSIEDLGDDAIGFLEEAAAHLAIALDNAVAHEQIAGLARELQDANMSLQAQNEELQVQGEELQAQNEELQAQSEELVAQQESLERTNQALERAEEQKNRFLAVLGHELRNPLAAISGAAALLGEEGPVGEESRAAIHEIITRQTRHLGRLLDDLLDLSRIATGKVRLARRRMDLRFAAQRCVELAAPAAKGGPRILLDAPAPVWIDADETRIEQVITNLLTNAMKYTPRDGSVSVTVYRDTEGAVLRVADTGAGIASDALPRVFDLFYQGSDHDTKTRGGLGIGLSLVRDLVGMHGGTIVAESPGEGRGTTMTVRFPALADSLVVTPTAPARRSHPPRTVVVVEDNEDVRMMMKLMLRRAGHTVAEANDGPTGVDAVTAALPDVALVDLDLPGFDGCEVARRLRQDPRLAGLRLVALSGYGRPEDRARALLAGFDEHLVKPVEIERLMETLEGPDGDGSG